MFNITNISKNICALTPDFGSFGLKTALHLSKLQDIADRATVTRLTVSKVEHGDPTVSMGIYARVLFALNLEKDITLLAADDALGRQLQDAELLRK